MEKLLASILSFAFGAPLYLPWILARMGIYKGWYLAYDIPPLIWKRAIFMWPASAVFVSPPFVALLGLKGDNFGTAVAIASVLGIILAVIMAIWTPGWAKPKWQRYLEDHYSRQEIRSFIPAWRKMDRRSWSQLLDSEAGIEQLVAMARAALPADRKSKI